MRSTVAPAKIFVVENHEILREALENVIRQISFCEPIGSASNGPEMIEKIEKKISPDIIILDIEMPGTDGLQTAEWLFSNRPEIKILIYSSHENPVMMMQLLQLSVAGFIPKNISKRNFEDALMQTHQYGSFYCSSTAAKIASLFFKNEKGKRPYSALLSSKEINLIRLFCEDLTYREIADKLNISLRSVENYKENLCMKLGIKHRIGLAMYGIKHRLVNC